MNEEMQKFYKEVESYVTPTMSNSHRKFHSLEHCRRMIQFYADNEIPVGKEEIIAILFHDFVYVIGSKTNEEESAKRAINYVMNHRNDTCVSVNVSLIKAMIMATATPFEESLDLRIRHFVHADWNGVMHWKSLSSERIRFLDEWEEGIAKEYDFFPTKEYIEGRMQFLKNAYVHNFLTDAVYNYMCSRLYSRLHSSEKSTLSPLTNRIPLFDNKKLTPITFEDTSVNTPIQNFDDVKEFIGNTVREKNLSFSEDEMKRIQSFINQMRVAVDDAVKNKHVVYVCACIHNSALSATYQQTEALVKEIAAKVRENHNNVIEEPTKRITAIDKFIRPKDPDHPDFMVFRLFVIPDQVMDQVMGVYDFDLAA